MYTTLKDKKDKYREKIMLSTLEVFNEKGFKLTMDDLAKRLAISKKTIYVVFPDKETLFENLVDYIFDQIKESERMVIEDPSLPLVDKIRKLLGVMPEGFHNVDFEKLYQLKDKFPRVYDRVEERLESGWEETIRLLKLGMEQGVIREVPICLIQVMMASCLEQFFQSDVLVANHMSYTEGLNQVVDILVDGIAVS